MKTTKLIEILMKDYRDIYDALDKSNHNHLEDGILSISPYHSEGSVLTHTMMVMGMADQLYPDDYINRVACLVHDFGKPDCREVKEKVTGKCVEFKGHAGVSSFVAKKFLEDPRLGLSRNDIVLIHKIVNLHIDIFQSGLLDTSGQKTILTQKGGEMFKNEPSLFRQLIRLTHCDDLGRISNTPQIPNLHEDLLSIADALDLYETKRPVKTTRTLHMLIGPAGVGKSTCRSKFNKGEVFISRDDILMETYPDKSYDQAWKDQDSQYIDCKLTQRFIDCINDNKDIVVDMTNLSRKSRKKFLSQVPKSYKKKAHVFICDGNELLQRVKDRGIASGKNIGSDVILNMMRGFTIPTQSEFDQIEFIFT